MNRIFLLVVVSLLGACSSENSVKHSEGNHIDRNQKSPLITRHLMGKIDKRYYDAELRVAKRWGINLIQVMGGQMGQAKSPERLLAEKNNVKANAYYAQKFGADWQERFKIEILQERDK